VAAWQRSCSRVIVNKTIGAVITLFTSTRETAP